ncbi:MAG: hypothetical protein K2M43_02440 [Mycoplasmoidaceae bacterium]|nr:hypothetical protein [Mycoplasmoidaceae bacterium]
MEYINKVQISGTINEIRHSEHGTYFVMLKQIVNFNNEDHTRLFEIVISPEHPEIIEKLSENTNVVFEGFITIFKVRKFNIYKQMINATKMEILA